MQLISSSVGRRGAIMWLFLYCVSIGLSVNWLWQYSYLQLQTDNEQQLDRFSRHLDSQLGRFAHIPQLLSHQDVIIKALQNADNTAQLDITNRHLASINNIIGASDAYLLDKQGNTIAASNWSNDDTFLGHNFAFRPYFKDAMDGDQGLYFALGSTSGKRGYYFSYPVRYAVEVIGVVVVKMDLSFIEKDWADKQQLFLVTDQNNIVFISTQSDILFKSLLPLSDDTKAEVLTSRRYLNQNIEALSIKGDVNKPISLIKVNHSSMANNYLSLVKTAEYQHWNIRVLAPISPLLVDISMLILFITLLFMLSYLSTIILRHAKTRRLETKAAEQKLKQKLEYTVMERTSALQAEVKDREKAELALLSTQKELVQSAKLALLGQLSASISHELNNPLAAIRSYAENAVLFLEKDNVKEVANNLKSIAQLTERMAKISTQLKSFARKSDGELREVALQPIIVAAHELLKPQLKATRTHLLLQLIDNPIYVRADPIQLEQIIVNLFSNALQSMQDCQRKLIEVQLDVKEESVTIKVLDIGSGIREEDLPRLFDPFFTTKETGLGLGLSISQQIITSMHGTLSARNRKNYGALFCISLPITTIHRPTDKEME